MTAIMRALAAMLVAILAGLGATPALAGAHSDYLLHCSGCHGQDAAGSVRGGVPDLRGYVSSFGQTRQGRIYLMHVPGVVASGLDDAGIARVMNYVMARWGAAGDKGEVAAFTPAEVERLRALQIGNVVDYRRRIVPTLEARDLPVAAYPWP